LKFIGRIVGVCVFVAILPVWLLAKRRLPRFKVQHADGAISNVIHWRGILFENWMAVILRWVGVADADIEKHSQYWTYRDRNEDGTRWGVWCDACQYFHNVEVPPPTGVKLELVKREFLNERDMLFRVILTNLSGDGEPI